MRIGAQLLHLLQTELILPTQRATLWSDPTTVLFWLLSDSCHYKVFVGTRVTNSRTHSNLSNPSRWNQGPAFLLQPRDLWPAIDQPDDPAELRKPSFCGAVFLGPNPPIPDPNQFATFQDLLDCTTASLHGAAEPAATLSAQTYLNSEIAILKQAISFLLPS